MGAKGALEDDVLFVESLLTADPADPACSSRSAYSSRSAQPVPAQRFAYADLDEYGGVRDNSHPSANASASAAGARAST